ncbi:lipoprotein/autotransporter domain-containing protein [Escherichia coli]|uniref:Lipoprotein/autotransporter domain-containing protein n=1 Tax=Escherichia coli TaxID=562 RepID=A0A376M7Q1_ECOLX|nr:hypothetical protein [Escherichia coli]STF94004.1 lipoprotein/autotransporter domain-containing protein [Escherichia coli]
MKTYLNSHHQRDDGKQREFQPYIEANWINNSEVYAVKMNGQTGDKGYSDTQGMLGVKYSW